MHGRTISNPLSSAVILGAMLLSCVSQITDNTDGSGTKTGNPATVTGMAVDSLGRPVAGATVTLRPTSYFSAIPESLPKLRATSDNTVTDSEGVFSFDSVDTGHFSIEINKKITGAVLRKCIMAADTGSIDLGADTVRAFAGITGKIDIAKFGNNTYVQVAGLERIVAVDSIGVFAIQDLPAGDFTLRIVSGDNTAMPISVPNVTIQAGATTHVPYPEWKHARQIMLNTTAAGKLVPGTVTDFPILIRLTAGNFSFGLAKSNGEDLRFAKSDGTPLAYEIERYNATLNRAEIWVKVDTIYGNDSTHSITMFYGNPEAASESNAASVFDTANGLMGVWHLGEPGSSTATDATGNGYDGVPSPSSPTAVTGNIGLAKRFDGISQYFTMTNTANSKINFPENGSYSVSAWVSVDTLNEPCQTILSKGNYQYSLEVRDTGLWAFTEFQNLVGWEAAISRPLMTWTHVVPKVWTLVTGIRSGDREILFIDDGLCVDTTNKFIASVKSRLNGFNLSIGRLEDPDTTASCYFGGMIDEVRIYNVAITRDWIINCFRNQVYTDELVKFGSIDNR